MPARCCRGSADGIRRSRFLRTGYSMAACWAASRFRRRSRACGRPVAVAAQRRRLLREQALVRRAVRRVARGAVLHHRGMLVDPRAALVGVAGDAQVVDGFVAQARLLQRAVRVVAVLAADLAFDDRVVRGLDDLAADVAVAPDARLVGELALRRRVRRGRELRVLDLDCCCSPSACRGSNGSSRTTRRPCGAWRPTSSRAARCPGVAGQADRRLLGRRRVLRGRAR